jgi:hypothetical protein
VILQWYLVAAPLSNEQKCIPVLLSHAFCNGNLPCAGSHVQWHKVIGNETGDYLKKVLQTADGGYIVARFREGTIVPTGSNSATIDHIISVSKFNASGEVE